MLTKLRSNHLLNKGSLLYKIIKKKLTARIFLLFDLSSAVQNICFIYLHSKNLLMAGALVSPTLILPLGACVKKNKVVKSVATEVQNRSKSPCFSCLGGGQRVRANTGYDTLTV